MSRSTCRSCGSEDLREFLSLGETPLADALVRPEDLKAARRGGEARYPLDVAFCAGCSLVQILETVSPEELFCRDYPYYSSYSEALLRHSRDNVRELVVERKLGPESLVVELASNDGYLLKNYVEQGIAVLGIDPAEGPARVARESGVETLNDFFGRDLAERLVAEGRRADVVHANNVLAHVADLDGFVRGLGQILKDDGVAVIEVPYLKDLIDHCEFDTIYHEHLCYFSVSALDRLLRSRGLFLNRVRRLSIHGGSLRLFVGRRERVEPSVTERLEEERQLGMTGLDYYRSFGERVAGVKTALLHLLRDLKAKGQRLAAYGAAAKGATLINYVGIGPDLVDFVVDRNDHKCGQHMPGQHLPIRSPEALLEEQPDCVLILAWNFKQEILAQQAEYRRRGGRFIVPIPVPEILDGAAP